MGTSSAYGGPGGNTPLVPTWLEPDGAQSPPATPTPPADGEGTGNEADVGPQAAPTAPPPIQQPPMSNRFTVARINLSQYASSGGSERASLGRAVSQYVSTSSGGARQAARRMGTSRSAGGRLLGFLSDVVSRGAREALRVLNLDSLAGQPIEDIFLGLADYVCPECGTIDEGIARDAFIETIVDLAQNGITDLNALTMDQMQTMFELYAAHAIEARLCNDVGTKVIVLPADVREAEQVQSQLFDFIRRGVADAVTAARETMQHLTLDGVRGFVGQVYEHAFAILEALGSAEAEA